jgi:5-methylcytosine-specific restriction endonuclease McrA
VLDRNGWRCQNCGSMQQHLHVHHSNCRAVCVLGSDKEQNLIALCAECHLTDALKRVYSSLVPYIKISKNPVFPMI